MSLQALKSSTIQGEEVTVSSRDLRYVDTLISPIRNIKGFQPKLGQGRAISLEQFAELYEADPLYHWVGFNSPLMYAAHRAAGAMTSLYRNLGTGCENLFKQIIMDEFVLTPESIRWVYVATSEEVQSFAGDKQPTIDF